MVSVKILAYITIGSDRNTHGFNQKFGVSLFMTEYMFSPHCLSYNLLTVFFTVRDLHKVGIDVAQMYK